MPIYDRLRVFVSSRMKELGPERQIIKSALNTLKVDGWVFEDDAGARPQSIRQTYLNEVEKADLYIGIFWKGYGAYTIEEYEHAKKLGKDCLIYEKRHELEIGRDPTLQEFLDELGKVETGHTIKWFRTPSELGELIKTDIAAWQTRKVRERLTPRVNLNLSLAEKKQRDSLLILLRKVRVFWIEGVLKNSVHNQALLDLGKESWSQKDDTPWQKILELPDQTSQSLRSEKSVQEIFLDVGQSLLILGQPGSGKTITLLDLTRVLLDESEIDPSKPVPVVFNLSSWSAKQPLLEWLVEELRIKYLIPHKSGTTWLKENWVLPMLDGLDEVSEKNRHTCVNAINRFIDNNGVSGLVVCSRLWEYEALTEKLRVGGAICIQEMSSEQVENYLKSSGGRLEGLQAVLQMDKNLRALSRTPLMLDVMCRAYLDIPKESILVTTEETMESGRDRLFDLYIERMFQRKGKVKHPWSREQVIDWLIWLARDMERHGQTVFLIEMLQPNSLGRVSQLLVYVFITRLFFGLIFALLFGLFWTLDFLDLLAGISVLGSLCGISFATIDSLRFLERIPWIKPNNVFLGITIYSLIYFLICFISLSLIIILAYGTLFELEYLLGSFFFLFWSIFWAIRTKDLSLFHDVRTVENLLWSWKYTLRIFIISEIFFLLFDMIWLINNPTFGSILFDEWPYIGLVLGLCLAIVGGLRPIVVETKTIPNQGIKRSMRYALGWGLLSTLIIGCVFCIQQLILEGSWDIDLIEILRISAAFGLLSTLIYGGIDVVLHYTLRFILAKKNCLPRKLVAFLDYVAKDLNLLQKVGGGYIFIHRYLLEHFAAMEPSDILRINEEE